jgi:hypothetical protein
MLLSVSLGVWFRVLTSNTESTVGVNSFLMSSTSSIDSKYGVLGLGRDSMILADLDKEEILK